MNRLSLAGTELEYFHVCAFFNSRDEEYAVMSPFYKEAVDQGEQICTSSTPPISTTTASA
jgi:hypothetical protein